MSSTGSSLEHEFAIFERHRREWVRTHRGKYVVIRGEAIAGFYDDYEAALRAGIKRFGLSEQFLIKQVLTQEPVFVVY